MVKCCLMKLSLSWIVKHKQRYVLSWISFAVISLFLVFVYSLAGGLTSSVTEYVQTDPTAVISADRMKEIASQYSLTGTVIAALFVSVCMVSLVNSLLVTIGENAAFMELFRVMGLRKSDYRFMTCFTAGVQGLIGGTLGILLSLFLTGPVFQIVRKTDLKGMDILTDLHVSLFACFLTLLICVGVAILTGLAASKLSGNVSAEQVADNELI